MKIGYNVNKAAHSTINEYIVRHHRATKIVVLVALLRTKYS